MVRILGVDPGTRRCGIAVTDSSETMAFPRSAVPYDDSVFAQVARVAHDEEVALVVVGRPLSLRGDSTASTDFADEFFRQLSDSIDLPVVQHDERFTTSSARRSLSDAGVNHREQRDRIDSAAAVVMLQDFADGRRAS
jgi:putative holliday junction resolvase